MNALHYLISTLAWTLGIPHYLWRKVVSTKNKTIGFLRFLRKLAPIALDSFLRWVLYWICHPWKLFLQFLRLLLFIVALIAFVVFWVCVIALALAMAALWYLACVLLVQFAWMLFGTATFLTTGIELPPAFLETPWITISILIAAIPVAFWTGLPMVMNVGRRRDHGKGILLGTIIGSNIGND